MSQQPFPLQPGQPEQPGQQYTDQPYSGTAAPYGTPPPPPAKKKRKWPWIVLAIIAFFVIVSVATGGGKDEAGTSAASPTDGKATAETQPKATAEAEEKAAGLNTAVRDGKFEFVVTGVETGLTNIGDNPYLAKKAQGQFVVIAMTVKNIGTKPQDFSPSSQKLKDTQGRTFESDSMAQIALGDSDVPVWDNINPGNTVQVKVVFDMPKDAAPSTMELHDSMFSGGATVTLK
ncbi:Mpr protein [Tsukamurella pulmonis]|uniref:DUF4352 domain-containing protein n=1 Tax=Tsukamurella pulmonis TaxID=47312 RepID=UPI00079CCF50|nr:DUF4352 domain-containing protein [Tsukamurella pulmonis]KXP10590.1 Mpr protein [Tsukamurella pulmonis]RDH12315.1 DUF4352 domain-containing protein [Tsukamurella pulmonis]